MGYQVRLEIFEGPLDLLLHLVDKAKLDITEVSLAAISQQYWDYLQLLRDLDLEIEGSFLVVFATLMEMKSRILLPPVPGEVLEETGEDPGKALVARLLEYKRYREAAQTLEDRARWSETSFPRPAAEPGPADIFIDCTLFDLIDALRGVLERVEGADQGPRLAYQKVQFSVPQKTQVILGLLKRIQRVRFQELFASAADREEVIVTFLALLELAFKRRITLFQEGPGGEIWVMRTRARRRAKTTDHDNQETEHE